MEKKKIINNKIVTASIWNFFGTFLLKAITYISVPIFTRIMSPEDYGYVSTYATYISFLGIVIGLSMNTATANARIDFSKRFDDYNSSIIKSSFIIFTSELIVGNIIFALIQDMLDVNRIYFNIIFIIAYCEYVVNTYYKINTVDFRFLNNLRVSISNALISLTISIALILILDNAILARLIGQGCFLFFATIILFVRIGFVKSNCFNINDIKYAKKIAFPNIFHQISQIIMSQSDRIIILNLCGAVTAAKYSVVYNFGLIMQMIWNALNEVWVPWLYRMLNEQKNAIIIKMSRIYLYVFTFISILAMLVAPDFMPILAPAAYMDAKNLIIPILVATYFMFLYSFFANIEIYYKKNKYMAISTMIAALVNIVGNYLFIPVYGYKVAAYTTLASYILLMLLHYIFLTYLFKLNIYSVKMFIAPIALAALGAIIAMLFLEARAIRYSIAAIMVLIIMIWAIVKKKVIMEFINSIRR